MLNKEVLISIFQKLLDKAKASYDEFNSADGQIGDGDLGVTILHGIEEINNNIGKFTDDMGSNFMICSQAFVKKSGSSFGTLIAFSLMNISKNLKEKSEGLNLQGGKFSLLKDIYEQLPFFVCRDNLLNVEYQEDIARYLYLVQR